MARLRHFIVGFAVTAFSVQLMLSLDAGVYGNELTRLTPEEAASVWGAGTNDCGNTELNGTFGCEGTGCTPAENASLVDPDGESKEDKGKKCRYQTAAGEWKLCGYYRGSTTCDEAPQ